MLEMVRRTSRDQSIKSRDQPLKSGENTTSRKGERVFDVQTLALLQEHDFEFLHGKPYATLWRDPGKHAWDTKRTDLCPFCHTPHNHSGGDGHRRSHCASAKRKPTFVCADGTVVYARDGYIIRTRKTPRAVKR